MQKIITWVVVILVVVWAIFTFTGKQQKQDTAPLAVSPANTGTNAPLGNAPAVANIEKASISYGTNGFSLSTITVKKGTEVVFSNESGKDFWPASAMHPTHTVYPGSSITKCGTADASRIFDACASIKSGSSWSFVFNEAGSWKYHDHLNATRFGTVVVTE